MPNGMKIFLIKFLLFTHFHILEELRTSADDTLMKNFKSMCPEMNCYVNGLQAGAWGRQEI